VRVSRSGSAHCYVCKLLLAAFEWSVVRSSCLSVVRSVTECASSYVSGKLDNDACLGQCLFGVTVWKFCCLD